MKEMMTPAAAPEPSLMEESTETTSLSSAIDKLNEVVADLKSMNQPEEAMPPPPKSIKELRNNIQERNKFKPGG